MPGVFFWGTTGTTGPRNEPTLANHSLAQTRAAGPGQIHSHDAAWLLVATYLCLRAYWLLSARAGRLMDLVSLDGALKVAVWLPGTAVVLWLMYRRTGWNARAGLGLGPGILRGLTFGLIATIPMMAAVALLPRKALDPDLVAGSSLMGPLAEEVLFRGFLFMYLIRRAGWSMPAALAVSSIAFGLAHIPNVDQDLWAILRGPDPRAFEAESSHGVLNHFISGSDLWLRDVIMLTTRVLPFILEYALPYAAGGAVFAWITYRWHSLWPAIVLHGLMNFWWDLTTGEHAQLVFRLDPMGLAQACSVVGAVWLTIRWSPGTRVLPHPPTDR